MPLSYDLSMSFQKGNTFVFGETPAASKWDQLWRNDDALADGSGLDDNSVTTAKLADGSVTAAKRSQVVASGIITGSTLGTTGNKSITGVGFTPKLVQFFVMPTASTTIALGGFGYMTSSAQGTTAHTSSSTGPAASRTSATDRCIGWVAAGSTTFSLACSYVSMDADGFTINVDTAANNFDVLWIAFA